METIPLSPVDPSQWATCLQAAAARPLEFCPHFPELAERHENWWNCRPHGGPLLISAFHNDPTSAPTRHLEYLQNPQAWYEARFAQFLKTIFSPDSFPWLRVDFGPVMLGGLLGGQVEFVSDTTWTLATIADDWSNAPDWTIAPENDWGRRLPQLMDLAAQQAVDRFIVTMPNLGAAADVLLNMRGSSGLCMDVLDQPERVRGAVGKIHLAWRQAFEQMWAAVLPYGAGLVEWPVMWSDQPYVVADCDFNYLIAPRTFRDLFLPEIARRAQTVGRSIFHLDGPGATRHIDALLEVPEIRAIQYVAGAGNKAADKLEMLKKIQASGRALQISCEADEVLPLARVLRPEGLAFLSYGYNTAQEMNSLAVELRGLKKIG